MSTTILTIEHPAEGSVAFVSDRVDVLILVRWPLDLETDEFVNITGRFRREDLERVAAATMETDGSHTVERGESRLTLERRGKNFTFDLARLGSMPKRLLLDFPLEHLQALCAETARSNG